MPLLVPTSELKPGMKLFEPLYSNRRIMLQAGKPLTEADISSLQRRYPDISVRIEDSVLDQTVEFEDDGREREIATRARRMVTDSVSVVRDRFGSRAALKPADFAALRSAVDEILEFLKTNRASAILVSRSLDSHNYLSAHTADVFYLSMLLGAASTDYVIAERRRQTVIQDLKSQLAADLTPLGLGTMVMDLGMLPLERLFHKRELLQGEDCQLLREHPNVGADMLPESFPPVAKVIVRTHHENCAGTGYPRQLPRDKIHVFARIVRIADAFSAATSERVYHGAKSPARALWEMTAGPYRCFYDQQLINTFASLIQPFPIGAKLRLVDGRRAVVVRYNRQNPFDPTVIISFDAQDRRLPKEQLQKPIRLSTRRDLRIKSFRGEDLTFIYTTDSALPTAMPKRFVAPLEAAYP